MPKNKEIKGALLKAQSMLKESKKDDKLIITLKLLTDVCDTLPEVELSEKIKEAMKKIDELFIKTKN